jgi:hypothetical protein
MKSMAFLVFFVAAFALAPHAQALNQDWGGAEDDWSMPTPTSYSGPTVTACLADGRKHQRCRDCRDKYDNKGQPTGLKVCAFVGESMSCGCTMVPTCSPYGSCVYLR